MATLFDDASLVMIPSGTKDGKLYSIKPTDGTGDFTFSRDGAGASPATRVKSDGFLETGVTNYLLQSNDFDTTWTTSSASVTGGQADKDGGTDAWLLESTSTTTSMRLEQSVSQSGVLCYSIYAKAGTTDWLALRNQSSATAVWFDLNNGVVGQENGSVIHSEIKDEGSGWYRINVVFDTCTSVRVYATDGDGAFSVTLGANVVIQNAMLNDGLVAEDYIATTTTEGYGGLLGDEPRLDYSGGATCPKLLLEPSRQNKFPSNIYLEGDGQFKTLSNVTFTDYTETGIRGKAEMLRVLETATTGNHNWYYDELTGLTNGTTYTFSFFAKSIGGRNVRIDEGGIGFNVEGIIDLSDGSILSDTHNNISVEDWGNGIYRIIATGTLSSTSQRIIFNATDGTTLSYAGDVTKGVAMTAIQYEEGSYASSPIFTYGSAVTRASENSAFELSVFDFFSLGNTESGTFFLETNFIKPSSQNLVDVFSQGGSGVNVWSDNLFQIRDTGGLSNFVVQHTNTLVDGFAKIAIRRDNTTFNVFVNGVKSATTATITNPLQWFEHIALYRNSQKVGQMSEFPTALSDSECIALTTL